ncbi:hypothetical protein [Arthrobacter glacialis]|uniref:DUF3093 domain-containing protein n=1 Tax=Arthrobacter glacialis TaxID=1664 RepID=A0A2S3ZY97_ARTGL|nr:hypothetical protein [Arthrobacter glacialis]POH73892.1 hypothetical protein CVS27_08225 [Arthrobacter glacialis]
MHGRSFWVRRAEQRLGPELGQLRHVAASRRIHWAWLVPCIAIGFVYGVIGQFISSPRSTDRTPDRFEDIPLFMVVSLLTGLVLWSLTLAFSFRTLLVFDAGIVTSFAQKATTRIFYWNQVNPESIKAVTSQDGSGPTHLLVAKKLTKLSVRGKYAVVFQAVPAKVEPATNSSTEPPQAGFWTFETTDEPSPLVLALQQAMVEARIPGAERIAVQALPPVVLAGRTILD